MIIVSRIFLANFLINMKFMHDAYRLYGATLHSPSVWLSLYALIILRGEYFREIALVICCWPNVCFLRRCCGVVCVCARVGGKKELRREVARAGWMKAMIMKCRKDIWEWKGKAMIHYFEQAEHHLNK